MTAKNLPEWMAESKVAPDGRPVSIYGNPVGRPPKVDLGARRGKGAMQRRDRAIDTLDKMGLDPIVALGSMAMGIDVCTHCDGEGTVPNPEDHDATIMMCPMCKGTRRIPTSQEIRFQCLKELAQYVTPKLRAMELESRKIQEVRVIDLSGDEPEYVGEPVIPPQFVGHTFTEQPTILPTGLEAGEDAPSLIEMVEGDFDDGE